VLQLFCYLIVSNLRFIYKRCALGRHSALVVYLEEMCIARYVDWQLHFSHPHLVLHCEEHEGLLPNQTLFHVYTGELLGNVFQLIFAPNNAFFWYVIDP
jgi:hypothetical protein